MALIVAALVSGVSLLGQANIDDRRAEREQALEETRAAHAQAIADEQNRRAERLENLRFVRERSSPDPRQPRPFARFDLQGQHMWGLQLRGADFSGAELQNAELLSVDLSPGINEAGRVNVSLTDAKLSNANLHQANLQHVLLSGTDFRDARLTEADLAFAFTWVCDFSNADLTGANLVGADLERADLTGTKLTMARYDDRTKWPYGFQPPPDARQVPLVPVN